VETGQAGGDAAAQAIKDLSDSAKPAQIAASVKNSPICARVMERFVDMYGCFASNAALFYCPSGGLFIAGGIVTKNETLFLDSARFAKAFERNYKDNIGALLRGVPLYIVRDYSISLYGCAQAALSLI